MMTQTSKSATKSAPVARFATPAEFEKARNAIRGACHSTPISRDSYLKYLRQDAAKWPQGEVTAKVAPTGVKAARIDIVATASKMASELLDLVEHTRISEFQGVATTVDASPPEFWTEAATEWGCTADTQLDRGMSDRVKGILAQVRAIPVPATMDSAKTTVRGIPVVTAKEQAAREVAAQLLTPALVVEKVGPVTVQVVAPKASTMLAAELAVSDVISGSIASLPVAARKKYSRTVKRLQSGPRAEMLHFALDAMDEGCTAQARAAVSAALGGFSL